MGKIRKIDPFNHETPREKKKRGQEAARNLASQLTLASLVDGTYRPPRIGNHAPPSTSAREYRGDTYQDRDTHQDHHHYTTHEDDGPNGNVDNPQSEITDHESLAATSAFSSWGSIPWDVPSSIPNRSSPGFDFLDPEITAAVQNRDRNAIHLRKYDNWQKIMSKLFPAYMWLKVKTQNWTATNSQDSFTKKFCKCKDDAPRFKQWIDLVDLTGQQRMRFSFCRCIPRPVQILANGFLPSSPSEPTAGFSMRLLAYHNHAWHRSNVCMAPFAETQQIFNEERSETLWNRGQTAGHDLKTCLSETILTYRSLQEMNLVLIQSLLQMSDLQKLASGTCPACFGPSLKTGLHRLTSVANRLNISFDGNFQHRHQKVAGRNAGPLIIPDMFIQPAKLDQLKEYIANQERIHKINKKADKCAASHKAGNDNRNETTWKACDDTGLMGACCRHDVVIHLANIHGTGENRALPLVILERIINTIEPDRPIGVLYDLGCSLDKFVQLRDIWPQWRSRLTFGTSVFHAYVHEWPCQVKYNPRYQKGWGLSDGESLERLWSALSPLVSPLRYATRNNRLGALAHRCKYRNKQSVINLASWLRKKFDQALVRRDTEKDFFRSQWQDQVRVALDKDEDAIGQTNLAMFYENEEVLNEVRDQIRTGPWPSSLLELNDIITTIQEREEAQHKLAALLGKDYEQLRGMRTTEVGMLTLLWKAKSDLFATAVDVRAERQPLISTNSGNILGTRLKEKIMAAIQRRSKPVDRAIKLFNQRRREYFQKYHPSRLRLPENQDMTLAEFQSMDLDDPLWNDGHFYHARAPWATDPLVRGGIRSVLLLDRVEEEIELLTQELDRAISWAHSYRASILSTIAQIELAAEEPVNVNDEQFSSLLTGFSMKSKLRLLHSELKSHLNSHDRLMVGWMPDVKFLWMKTRCQYTKNEHPWFDVIETVQRDLTRDDMGFIDDAFENLTFAENGTSTQEEERDGNDLEDFEIPPNEQSGEEGANGRESDVIDEDTSNPEAA
ncbi:hypothetical protein Pst134EA_001154 [Puccinia striiformis f. sp. tritici]|uniref:hypothetical protein n=1 Tax=Puccinia striiformis f. sp. tritici TaxID=168172 RepID=UPI002007C32C|nr:hypothetical protein Pst134EA_001154 [Puccinia striiformis f. sp. tritici]KAH9474109.1 hypothetical protein Pst134EA_001154 [Puccinia striiformis f. sp. tritici]